MRLADRFIPREAILAAVDTYELVEAYPDDRRDTKTRSALTSMIDWSTCQAVERDPRRVSGAWIFRGTRVPVSALFENLEEGADVSEFASHKH